MKFLLTITVPGEIAECESPGEIERTAPGTVRVDLGMAAARAKMERLRKEGKSKRFRAGDPTLVLKFRMPEGESIPAEKLTEPEAPRGK